MEIKKKSPKYVDKTFISYSANRNTQTLNKTKINIVSFFFFSSLAI